MIDQPSKEETLEILRGIKSRYEEFHEVTITDDALIDAVELTRYITDRQLPDKAVDVIDEAASKVMLKASRLPKELLALFVEETQLKVEQEKAKENSDIALESLLKDKSTKLKLQKKEYGADDISAAKKVVNEKIIAEVVASWTGVPVSKITEAEGKKLLRLEADLKKKVIGQEDAIKAVTRAIKRAKVGLKSPNKPTGTFLFLGPTGVGKTEMARTMADYLFGDRDALIRIEHE